MALAFPWFAAAGIAAAVAVAAAHMIFARTRAPEPLPTARFVPLAQEKAAAVERRPRDLLLLALRAGALLLAGLALAQPVTLPRPREPVHVVIADIAGSGNPEQVLDSASRMAGSSGRVVISDSLVRTLKADELRGFRAAGQERASLTGALVRAIREAADLRSRGHSVELAIISAFTQESVDSATADVRGLWPGSIQLASVSPPTPPPQRGPVEVRAAADDPLRVTIALVRHGAGTPVLIVRDSLTRADSSRVQNGQAVVHWPREAVPSAFDSRANTDTIGGVAMNDYTLVAPFTRSAMYSEQRPVRVLARWIDGEPAAIERRHGSGCIREVAIPVADVGDLPISRGFLRVVGALTEPCGERRSVDSLALATMQMLGGVASGRSRTPVPAADLGRSRFAPWLLGSAILALLIELLVRRRRGI